MADSQRRGLAGLRDRLRPVFARFWDASIQRFARQSSWMLANTGASIVLGIVQIALLSRLLGKDAYGLFVLIVSAATTIRQFLSLRVWEWATVQLAGPWGDRDSRRAAAVMQVGMACNGGVNLLSLAILIGISDWFSRRYLDGALPPYVLVVYGLTLCANWAGDVCFSLLRLANEYRWLAIQGFFSATLRCVVLGAVVWATRSVLATVIAYVVIEFILATWFVSKSSRVFRAHFGTSWYARGVAGGYRELIARTWRLLLVGSALDTLKIVGTRADALILGWYHSPTSVGVYQAANNFIERASLLLNPLAMVAFSDVARFAAVRDRRNFLVFFLRTSFISGAVGLALALVLYLFADLAVWIIYGQQYAEAGDLLRILCWGLLAAVTNGEPAALASVNRQRWTLQMFVIGCVVKLTAALLIVPSGGATSLAYVHVLYSAIFIILMPYYVYRLARITRAWPPSG